MASATNTLHSTTEQIKNKANEGASMAGDKSKQAAGAISDTASMAADKAKQAAGAFGQKAEDATHAVGAGMKSLADSIRDRGPHEGVVGSATSSLASSLESGGRYLQREGIKGIADDMTSLIRNNPIPALLLGVGLGFILARATARR
jgi:hypothetical protein